MRRGKGGKPKACEKILTALLRPENQDFLCRITDGWKSLVVAGTL